MLPDVVDLKDRFDLKDVFLVKGATTSVRVRLHLQARADMQQKP